MTITMAALAVVSASVVAHGNTSYWQGSDNAYVKSATGQCVRTGSWTKETAVAECEPGMAVKTAAAAEQSVAKAAEVVSKVAPVAKVKVAEPVAAVTKPAADKLSLKEEALFDISKAELNPKGKSELDALVTKFKDKNFNLEKITVTGHASATGPTDFNQSLSERRAATVKNYLMQNGIAEDRIVTAGMGDKKPIADNTTAKGRALNRRVEIEIDAVQLPKN